MNVLRTAGCVLVGLVVACGSDNGPPPAHSIEKVTGDTQSVAVQTASAPLVVRVLDDADQPAAGIPVVFAVTVGTGAVATVTDTSDVDGLASTIFTGSISAGARKIRAQCAGGQVVFDLVVAPGTAAHLTAFGGVETSADAGTVVPVQLGARAYDGWGNPVPGVPVVWNILSGGGSLSADTVLTDATGFARVTRTLGPGAGGQVVRATTPSLPDSAIFHQTARKAMTVLAGGNNVPERYTSDLWVTGNYAYSGTWGGFPRNGASGNVLKVWDVSAGPVLTDSIVLTGVGTTSDDEVSADGTLLLVTAESGFAANNGLYIYSLADPAHPALLGFEAVSTGLHTGTFADIGGQRYVFAAKDPGAPALMVFRIQPDSTDKIVQVASVPQLANYGIHDQFIRDGYAFVSVWNTGLKIYDVGNGSHGGTPDVPVLVSTIVTQTDINCTCVHNAWWYHDAAGGKQYLFIGQEGPGSIGTSSSGDIHLVDVSNLAAPEEIGVYHMGDVGGQHAGVHNFWADESRGILYAAYYNGGVLALDVSGHLFGDLSPRVISTIRPGGNGNTYVWGVMLANGALWVSDMLSGFWKVSVP